MLSSQGLAAMQRFSFPLATLATLRQRQQQQQAVLLGKLLSKQHLQGRQQQQLAAQIAAAWAADDYRYQRAKLLQLLAQRQQQLAEQQGQTRQQIGEQQQCYQQARRLSLTLSKLYQQQYRNFCQQQQKKNIIEQIDIMLSRAVIGGK